MLTTGKVLKIDHHHSEVYPVLIKTFSDLRSIIVFFLGTQVSSINKDVWGDSSDNLFEVFLNTCKS